VELLQSVVQRRRFDLVDGVLLLGLIGVLLRRLARWFD
jgi:hypothetical protein